MTRHLFYRTRELDGGADLRKARGIMKVFTLLIHCSLAHDRYDGERPS